MISQKLFFARVLIIFVVILFKPAQAIDPVVQQQNGQPLMLLGAGLQQILTEDVYLGALYTYNGEKNISNILDETLPKRMTLKIVGKRLPSHRISRMWKERIAMNSKRDQWSGLGRQILEFANLFKEPLIAGDRVDIDYLPGEGTKILINDVEFGQFKEPAFFKLLLKTWVGALPPTKAFKNGVLGRDSIGNQSALVKRSKALLMIVGRLKTNQAKAIAVAKAEPTLVDDSKQASLVPDADTESALKVADAKPQAEQESVAKKATPAKPVETQSSAQIAAEKKAAAAKAEAEREAAARKRELLAQQRKREEEQQQRLAAAERERQLAVDRDLIRGAYKRDLINALREYQVYPPKAWHAGVTGDALIEVTIDRKGNVINTNFIERTGKTILDRAVRKMVRKAEPLPKIPEQLAENQFNFTVPVVFTKK